MALIVLAPLVAALAAAALTWQHATRLDRQSLQKGCAEDPANERRRWALVLGGLTAAVLAVAVLQTILLAGLRSLSG